MNVPLPSGNRGEGLQKDKAVNAITDRPKDSRHERATISCTLPHAIVFARHGICFWPSFQQGSQEVLLATCSTRRWVELVMVMAHAEMYIDKRIRPTQLACEEMNSCQQNKDR